MTKIITLPNLLPGTNYVLQIKADRPTGSSDWSQVLQFKTATDNSPPAKPSTPTVKAGFKNMVVGWNGRNASAGTMDDDFSHVEIHAAPNSTYTPSEDTLVTTMYGAIAQEGVIDGLENGVETWVKLVAVDVAGNKSAPSDSASGTPQSITGIDIEALSIEVANINFDAGDIGGPYAFYQSSEPTTRVPTELKPVNPIQNGDVWYDTDDAYKMYTFNGGRWNAMKAEAEQTETGAKIYRQATAPTSGIYEENDIWFDTANGNRVNLWSGSAWVIAPLGTGAIANTAITNDLLAANINAGKITVGTMLGDRIASNTLDASKITAGTITSDRIGANAITAGKIRAGTITAGDGIIANAAIDYAQIGSVSASTITVNGTMSATMTVSGTIRTSSSLPRVEMTSSGLRMYNSVGSTVADLSTSAGSANLTGNLIADTFYSRNYLRGGGFLQIGNSNLNEDNNDEIRFFQGSAGVALRNPTNYPGRLRVSMRNAGGQADTVDFDINHGVIAQKLTLGGAGTNGYPQFSKYGGWTVHYDQDNNRPIYFGSVNTFHSWIANDWVGIKLLGSSLYAVQIRNASDSGYGNFQAARGDFSSLYVNGSSVSSPDLSNYVTRGSTHTGGVSTSSDIYTSGRHTGPNRQSGGNGSAPGLASAYNAGDTIWMSWENNSINFFVNGSPVVSLRQGVHNAN